MLCSLSEHYHIRKMFILLSTNLKYMIKSVEWLADGRWNTVLVWNIKVCVRWERRIYCSFVCVAVPSECSISIQEKNPGILKGNSIKALSLCTTVVKETEYCGGLCGEKMNKADSTTETYDFCGSVPLSWKGMNRTAEGTMQSNKEKKVQKSFCTGKWLNKSGFNHYWNERIEQWKQ